MSGSEVVADSLPQRVSSRPLVGGVPAGIWLALVLALAAGVRFYRLPQLGFWTDELFSLSDANGWGLQSAQLPGTGLLPPNQPHLTWRVDRRGWGAMIEELSRSEIHPPLYFLMLRGWEDLLGGAEDEVSVRSLSVILSVAAVGLLYGAVREQHPPATALWAATIMALAGPQIEYAQEARDYIPILTFALAGFWSLLRIEQRGPSPARLVALSLSLLALLLTHYFSIALVGAMGLYAVLQLRGSRLSSALAALLASGLVYAVAWGPFMLRQVPNFHQGHAWLMVNSHDLRGRELHLLLTLPLRYLCEIGASVPLATLAPWLGLFWLLVPIGLLRPSTRLWALSVGLPLALVLVSDWRESMTQLGFVRFTLGATPGFYVLIATATEPLSGPTPRPNRWAGHLLPAAATALAVIALPRAYIPPWKLDFRTPASFIAARMNPRSDALVFVGPPGDETWTAISYHDLRHFLPHDPATLVVLQHRALPPLLARLQRCRTVWVVSRALHQPVQEYLPGYHVAEEGEVPDLLRVLRGTVQPSARAGSGPATAPAPAPAPAPPR